MHLSEAVARLLSEPSLRESFRTDRSAVARHFDLSPEHEKTFLSIDESQLAVQAEALIKKRFHEIAKLLPHSVAALGVRAEDLFEEYANDYWPRGHRRHLDDAVHFGAYLLGRVGSGVNRAELNRLRFALDHQRFAIHAVSDLMVGGKPRRAIQFFYRTKGKGPRFITLRSRFPRRPSSLHDRFAQKL